ncbi:unnamed protein product [Linum tenue]|uniref:Peptidase A1 domain-containing protein n=2 Tax=Linum tenue TaxID=586396 RepID=A0AAV0GUA4_9ROSI|nr:unnamed protein product [Linum tenue]
MAASQHLHCFYITATIITYVLTHSCADGARPQDLGTYSLQQQAPTNPIHTDRFGVGVALPVTAGPGGGSYVVTVGFGTPKVDFPLLFDTGSDVSWVYCHSCSQGCSPGSPTFNPSLSSTSSSVPCKACDYTVEYHDRSQSIGVYARDTISLADTESQEGFIFGCAEKVSGDFGRTAGVLGLGQGQFSLLAQTDPNLFSIFCYCLPPTDSGTGVLWFGVQAMESCRPGASKMISLVVDPNNNGLTNYFVKFTGITIGSQRLDFNSLVSSPMSTIIDSGTVVTRLPPAVYSALRAAFRGMMSGYPAAEPTNLLDTCYNLEGREQDWTPPTMVMHFEDSVDVGLDPSAVTLREGDGESASRVCLAFAGNGDENELTIIGTQQHRGLRVYYDINGQKLAFAAGGC